MKKAQELTMIAHNLFPMKFYMSDDAPSIDCHADSSYSNCYTYVEKQTFVLC